MNPASIVVSTGSRLHFGMFSFGWPSVSQFGGVGAMIDAPAVEVRLSRSEEFAASGPMAQRALATAHRVWQFWGEPPNVACRIEVLTAPRQHVGLGSGTQLALAVAAGMCKLCDSNWSDPKELARTAGRGRRSAIGLYGFLRGGLLMEAGKQAADEISPLSARVQFPATWRWVLVCPKQLEGLSGHEEQAAFDRLPPVPAEVTARLMHEAEHILLPAAAAGDFNAFSRSLHRFGQLAGSCFKTQQAGLYATPETAALAEQIRALGVEGVGQSSWGPTLFALAANEDAARELVAEIQSRSEFDLDLIVARPRNVGVAMGTGD
jgi:beta-ribofuranosylaminobenzene 5'-phosphate synthase